MTPAHQEWIDRRCRKVQIAKKHLIANLKDAASDCARFCVVDADKAYCVKLLKAAAETNRSCLPPTAALISFTIEEGFAEGAARVQQSQIDRSRDPWEAEVSAIPSQLIHRTRDGRDVIASADIITHLLHTPVTSMAGRRLSSALRVNGWRRHASGLVKIGGRNFKGFWRFTAEAVK